MKKLSLEIKWPRLIRQVNEPEELQRDLNLQHLNQKNKISANCATSQHNTQQHPNTTQHCTAQC